MPFQCNLCERFVENIINAANDCPFSEDHIHEWIEIPEPVINNLHQQLNQPTLYEMAYNLVNGQFNPERILNNENINGQKRIMLTEFANNNGINLNRNIKKRLYISAAERGEINYMNYLEPISIGVKKLALPQAAYHGQLASVKYLVENQGVSIHLKNEISLTYAATCHSNNRIIHNNNPKQGNLDVVEYLLNNGGA